MLAQNLHLIVPKIRRKLKWKSALRIMGAFGNGSLLIAEVLGAVIMGDVQNTYFEMVKGQILLTMNVCSTLAIHQMQEEQEELEGC